MSKVSGIRMPFSLAREPACSGRGHLTLVAVILATNRVWHFYRTDQPNEMREGGPHYLLAQRRYRPRPQRGIRNRGLPTRATRRKGGGGVLADPGGLAAVPLLPVARWQAERTPQVPLPPSCTAAPALITQR